MPTVVLLSNSMLRMFVKCRHWHGCERPVQSKKRLEFTMDTVGNCGENLVGNSAMGMVHPFLLHERRRWWVKGKRTCIGLVIEIADRKWKQPQMVLFIQQPLFPRWRWSLQNNSCRGHFKRIVWRRVRVRRGCRPRLGTRTASASTGKTVKREGRDKNSRRTCLWDTWKWKTMCEQRSTIQHPTCGHDGCGLQWTWMNSSRIRCTLWGLEDHNNALGGLSGATRSEALTVVEKNLMWVLCDHHGGREIWMYVCGAPHLYVFYWENLRKMITNALTMREIRISANSLPSVMTICSLLSLEIMGYMTFGTISALSQLNLFGKMPSCFPIDEACFIQQLLVRWSRHLSLWALLRAVMQT